LLAPPGAYTWTIDAGPTVRPATGSLGAKAPSLALSSVTAEPAVASTSSVVSYSVSMSATVTGTLVDSAGHTVSQLFSEAKPAGRQSFTVDVSTVPDGQYTVVVQAQVAGSEPVSDVVGIQVDRGVSAFTASATAFSPNGDGVQDSISLDFTLTQPAAVSLQLVKDNAPLGSLVSGSYDAGAPITVSWDGTLNGQPVGDGQFTLSLTIGSAVHTLPVTVDTKPPTIRPISWKDLRFNVSEAGSVSLVVGDRTYVKKVPRPGSVYFWFRSRPQSFTVSATDLAGNATSLQHP
jgi:flagellar hook assembly protein FlgD